MLVGGAPEVEPLAGLVPYDVDEAGAVEVPQRAVDGGESDRAAESGEQGVQFLGGDELPAAAEGFEHGGALRCPAYAGRRAPARRPARHGTPSPAVTATREAPRKLSVR